MNNLVVLSLEKYIKSNYDKKSWNAILEISNLNYDDLLKVDQHAKSDMQKFIEHASQYLNIAIDELLVKSGEYWAETVYENELQNQAFSFPIFLKKLNKIHGNILENEVPNSKLSSSYTIYVTNENEAELYVYFRTKIREYSAFILGLINGIGRKFNAFFQIENANSIDFPNGLFEALKVSYN